VLEVESLRIADAYEWLGTGERAGRSLFISQSTVSRSIKQFRVLSDQIKQYNCMELLEMERVIHQKWRFHQGEDLRLHVFRWSNHLIAKHAVARWRLNPAEVSVCKRSVLELLERRVIDAVCAPYPLIATADKDIFACLPLYRSCLQVMTNKNFDITHEKGLCSGDIATKTALGTLPFVPPEAAHCSAHLDAIFFDAGESDKTTMCTPARYWGTPLTPLIMPDLNPLDYVTSIPYEEYLVVRKEWEGHPHVSVLHQMLNRSMQRALGDQWIAGLIDFVA
jgi:hypothetical protein